MSDELEKPSSHTLNELKKHLKSKQPSKTDLCLCLERLKKNPQSSKNFIKAGGLVSLVQLLRFQDIKIMNTSLSILANMCLNSDVRNQVSPLLNVKILND